MEGYILIKKNYGKYKIPKRLKQLVDLQQQLNINGQLKYGDLLGYYFSYESINARYFNTPVDVIPFARNGMDGMHFGFLTDFGQVTNLHEAYIVRVSPMAFDSPVHIVAKNIDDFIHCICFYPHAMDILNIMSSQKEIVKFSNEHPSLKKETILMDDQYTIHKHVYEKFSVTPIDNLAHYFAKTHHQRSLEMILPTIDQIGVVGNRSFSAKALNTSQLYSVENKDELSIAEITSFFETATLEAKLVFIRDAQSKGLILNNDALKAYLREQLCLLDLFDEAERMIYT